MKTIQKLFLGAMFGLLPVAPAAAAGWGSSMYQYAHGDVYIHEYSTACQLSFSAEDTVLRPGKGARLNVHATFPNDAYAFAESDFDVLTNFPGWTLASDGVIAGGQVLGAYYGQDHLPFTGVFADDANPIRIWTGRYTPASYEPRLVKLSAIPHTFSYYPSELTSSSADCEATAGSQLLFVNPLTFGPVGVVPGAGTTMEQLPSGSGVRLESADERVETAVMSHGVTVLAWARVDGVSPIGSGEFMPDGLVLEAAVRADGHPTDTFSVNFARIEYDSPSSRLTPIPAIWSLTARGGDFEAFEYTFFRGGVSVGAGSFEPEDPAPLMDAAPSFFELAGIDGEIESSGVSISGRFKATTSVLLPNGPMVQSDGFEVRARTSKTTGIAVDAARLTIDGATGMDLTFDNAPPALTGGYGDDLLIGGTTSYATPKLFLHCASGSY